MPSKEQLETALINADKAGDTASAKKLANALKGGQYDQAPPKDAPVTEQPKTSASDINPVLAGVSEFAAGANNAAIELLDFLGPDQINSMLQLAGSKTRVPTLGEQDIIQSGTKGGFVDEGLGQDILRTGGSLAAVGGAAGQAVRQGARQLPRLASGSESVGAGALRQMGASSPTADIAAGALAGAGSEAGGELGEAVGGPQGRQVGEMLGAVVLPSVPALAKAAVRTGISAREVTEAIPGIARLKDEARAIYKQVDNLGVTINQKPLETLYNSTANSVRNQGFNAKIHPKVGAALGEMEKLTQGALTVSEIDVMRRVARAAARSLDPDEARLGSMMVQKIDDFLDDVPKAAIQGATDNNVGPLLKQARTLWGRAKRSEIIDDAVYKAENQASGFENGIRSQFRSILNSKRKMAGFSAEERKAIELVVRGGKAENIAKALGKFGFTEGQSSSMLLSSLGVAGGVAAAGPGGGVAVPLIGQGFKKLAQGLTVKNARLANELIKAGADGNKIINAYFKAVPKSQRTTKDLTALLIEGNANAIPLKKSSNKIVSDAAYFASVISAASQEDQGD